MIELEKVKESEGEDWEGKCNRVKQIESERK